jgi:hypothetical protein
LLHSFSLNVQRYFESRGGHSRAEINSAVKCYKETLAAAIALQRLLMPSTLTAVASATTIAPAPAATVASAAAPVAASTPAATGRARLSRPSLVYGQWAAFHALAVEFGDGILSVLLRTHGYERKAARFAGEFILHERHFLDGTRL